MLIRSNSEIHGYKCLPTTYPAIRKPQNPSEHTSKKPSLYLTNTTAILADKSLKLLKRPSKKPIITSKSWIISDSSGQILQAHNENEPREIASLTKIMTCIVVIEEILRNRRSFQEYIHVSEVACKVEGTKAGLSPRDSLKIWDLLHGLMLPSGNDAALVLAESIGRHQDMNSNPIANFVGKMNQLAKCLKLESTTFANPHGLSNATNRSTAKNVATLTAYGLKIPIFKKIVSRTSYECLVYSQFNIRKVAWVNTNKLLWKGFSGAKTGYTPTAGPCLCSCIEGVNRHIVIVLLGCSSMQKRWGETIKLWRWSRPEDCL